MPIPTTRTDLSATIVSNSPAGSDAPTDGDNFLRAHAAFIRQNYDDIQSFASTADVGDGDALIGVKRADTGIVATTLHTWINRQPLSFGSDFGADDGGVTVVSTTLQAALDAVEARGGGQLVIPWPATQYNLGTTTILIPANTELYVQGTPNIVSGGQPFKYSGTGAAFATKRGENDLINNRGIAVINVGVELTGVGATGFRFRRIRDLHIRGCAVRITANSQTGFHFMGERSGGTYQGVFDAHGERLVSYATSSSLTGVKHYVLSGTDGDGQCNSNTFVAIRGGGVGKFIEVGPSLNNGFYNISMEAPGATDNYIHCLAGALYNSFFDLYAGDAPSGYSGKVFKCDTDAKYNVLYGYNPGQNVDPEDVDLGVPGDLNQAVYAGSVRYVPNTSGGCYAAAIQGEAFSRVEVRPDNIRFGDGTSAPIRAWPGHTVENNIYSSALGTLTPNILTGRSKFVRFDSGASGTLTIAEPTNANSNGGDEVEFYIYNNSGGSINLTWNAAYIPAASFPTSISNGTRLVVLARNVATSWWYR